MPLVAGFDGYRGGWVGVVLADGRFYAALVMSTITQAMRELPEAEVVTVDIPIRLPEQGGVGISSPR